MGDFYFSIDVEDWFQVENLRPAFPMSIWDQQEWHVEANVERLLQILSDHDSIATFFILGGVAEKFPDLVKKINKSGHEVASHGHSHKLLYDLTDDELYQDLDYSKKLLEDIIGEEVAGFRAPSFSISDDIVKVLSKVGYKYDSSFNDFGSHDRYGYLSLGDWQKKSPGVYKNDELDFIEIPIQNLELLKLNIPWGGGGYFRMIPWWIFKRGIKKISSETPYIFYMHPWEIDTKQPYISELSMGAKFRHYTNISKVEDRLDKLLSNFHPGKTMRQLSKAH